MPGEKKHNVLVVANKPPYPPVDGGCFAMGRFEQLLRPVVNNLLYFAISTPKHPFNNKLLPAYWKLNRNFFTSHINTAVNSKHVARYMSGSSLRAARFYTPGTEKKILEIIEANHIDTVIFESIYAAVYMKAVQRHSTARCILRTHNIEHQIWEKHYEQMPKGLKRFAFRSETERLKKFELQCLSHANGTIFISGKDEEYGRKQLPAIKSVTIPVQVEAVEKPASPGSPLTLFHIGAMDWQPNVEGVKRFLETIFPSLLKKFPHLQLHLAGKSMPEEFNAYASSHVYIHGEVKDADDFIRKYDVCIVPLLSGSGIRIKILEAMGHGKPVITTDAGIHGIPATAGTHYLLANTLHQWEQAVQYVLDTIHYHDLSKNSLEFIRQHYSTPVLQTLLTEFIY